MNLDPRNYITNQIWWLIGITLPLLGLACSGLITIRTIETPEPMTEASSQTAVGDKSLAGSGIPTRIVAEVIDLDAPVVEMGWQLQQRWGQVISEWDVPDAESGWHSNSAQPGQSSNIVISGHNNSLGGHVFGQLEELNVGDKIILWTDKESSHVYQVSEKQIIRAFAASQENLDYLQAVMEPTVNEQLTLITCWPNWTNTHRLIVIAAPL